MNRAIGWICTVFVLTCASPALGQAKEQVKVTAAISPRSAYVGQVVALTVQVIGLDSPSITTPQITNAAIRPTTHSQTGNEYVAHYRVLPRRAGRITIPPIEVKQGGRAARTRPVVLNAVDPPSVGRTSAFLGGIGAFELEARVERSEVQVGDSIEYEITMTGPASIGSTSAPLLERLAALAARIRFERLPDRVVDEPPSRTFVYRIRLLQVGDLTLPPETISAFDPLSQRYMTKAIPRVKVSVKPLPELDRAKWVYGPSETAKPRRLEPAVVMFALLAIGLAGACVLWEHRRRKKTETNADLGRIRATIEAATEPEEIGRVITEGLAAYLKFAIGRDEGALTPLEAEEGIERATGSSSLADQGRTLIEACDQARFSSDPADRQRLRESGLQFFHDLPVRPSASKQ